MINPYRAVEYMKQNFPTMTRGKPDSWIFEEAKRRFPEHKYPNNPFNAEQDDIINFTNPVGTTEAVKKEIDKPFSAFGRKLEEEDTSPGLLENLFSTSGIEYFGDPQNSEWWANAYNNSTAGMIYQAMHGKTKYDIGDYHPEWYEEIGQFFMGLASPVDIGLFAGSGGLGKLAAQGVGKAALYKSAAKGFQKRASIEFAEKPFARAFMANNAIEQGVTLGSFGAAHGALMETSRQRAEGEEIDLNNIAASATKNGFQSLLLGGATGALRGRMGLNYQKALRNKSKSEPMFNRAMKNKTALAINHPWGQVVSEAAAFTGGEVAMGSFTGHMGEMEGWNDFWKHWAKNIGIIGGLRFNPITGHTREMLPWAEYASDAVAVARFFEKLPISEHARAAEALRGLKENITPEIENAIMKEGLDLELDLLKKQEGFNEIANVAQKLAKIKNKFTNEDTNKKAVEALEKERIEGRESLTKEEKILVDDAMFFFKEGHLAQGAMFNIYDDWRNNIREKRNKDTGALEDLHGEFFDIMQHNLNRKTKLTLEEKMSFRENLETNRQSVYDYLTWVNQAASGRADVVDLSSYIGGWQPFTELLSPSDQTKNISVKLNKVSPLEGKAWLRDIVRMPLAIGDIAQRMTSTGEGKWAVGKEVTNIDVQNNTATIKGEGKVPLSELRRSAKDGTIVKEKPKDYISISDDKGRVLKILQFNSRKKAQEAYEHYKDTELPNFKKKQSENKIEMTDEQRQRLKDQDDAVQESIQNPIDEASKAGISKDSIKESIREAIEATEVSSTGAGKNIQINIGKIVINENASNINQNTLNNSLQAKIRQKKGLSENINPVDVIINRLSKLEKHILAVDKDNKSDIIVDKGKGVAKGTQWRYEDVLLSSILSKDGLLALERLRFEIKDNKDKNLPFDYASGIKKVFKEHSKEDFRGFNLDDIYLIGDFLGEMLVPKGGVKSTTTKAINQLKRFGLYLQTRNKRLSNFSEVDLNNYLSIRDRVKGETIPGHTIRMSHGEISPIKQFVEHINGSVREPIVSWWQRGFGAPMLEAAFKSANERPSNMKPAKRGLRKKFYEELYGKEYTEVERAVGELYADYYLRDSEIPYIHFDNIKTTKVNGKDVYYLDTTSFAKDKTKPRPILLNKEFAIKLKEILSDRKNMDKPLDAEVSSINKLVNNNKEFTDNYSTKQGESGQGRKDFRHRAERIGYKENINQGLLNYVLGHGRERIKDIYHNVGNLEQSLKDQMAFRKKMRRSGELETSGLANYNSRKGQAQFLPVGGATETSVLKKFIKRKVKQNKGLEAWVNESASNSDYAGRFFRGAIELVAGKANEQSFFHENYHRLKDFARSTKDESLMGLINNLEKMTASWIKKNGNKKIGKETVNEVYDRYVSKYGKKKALDEFLADQIGSWANNQHMNKSFKNRIGQWAKNMILKIKKYVFGTEDLSRSDTQQLLGRKVFKGFDTRGAAFKGEMKYQFSNVNDALKNIHKEVNRVIKDRGIDKNVRQDFVSYIASLADIQDPANFKISKTVKREGYGQELNDFYSALRGLSRDVSRKKLSDIEWLNEYSKTEQIIKAPDNSITKEKLADILRVHFDVTSGRTIDASTKQLKRIQQIVYNQRFRGDKKLPRWIQEHIMLNEGSSQKILAESMVLSKKYPMLGAVALTFLPVESVLQSLGLKTLKNQLIGHQSTEIGHVGRSLDRFNIHMTDLLGRKKYEKMRENMFLLDKDGWRFIERLKLRDKGMEKINGEKVLSPEMEVFFRKAIKKEWFDHYEKTGKAKDLRKFINIDTNEGMLAKRYTELTDYFVNETKSSLKQVLSESQYENFVEKNPIQWIKDGVYVTRRVTDQFKQWYKPDRRPMRKFLDESRRKHAEEIAKDMFETDNPTKEQLANDKVLEMADSRARAGFEDMINFNDADYSSGYTKRRYANLDEFIEIEPGKWIKTYETDFKSTVEPYAIGMSKFVSNVEYFPEYVNLKGFDFFDSKAFVNKIRQQDPVWGSWVADQIRKQMGVADERTVYQPAWRVMEKLAKVTAKLGLSFPLSGVKNLFVGQSQNLYAFQPLDVIRSWVETLDVDNRRFARATGAPEMGMHPFKEGPATGFADKWFFKFGLMKPTENINRYTSVLAGRIDQRRLIQQIQTLSPDSGRHKKAVKRLKKFYELNEQQIDLLKRFGEERVSGRNLDKYAAEKIQKELNDTWQQMATMAHIRTQGASMNLFMPEWADSRFIKPLTLYKRMAYAATVNTKRNIQEALQDGHVMKLFAGTAGTYMSGEALLWMYDKLLGESMPKEGTGRMAHLKTILWKGEFGGIASEILSPFEGQSFSIKPAISNNFMNLWNNLTAYKEGTQFFGETADNIARRTISLYNGYRKATEKGAISGSHGYLLKDVDRFHKLYSTFTSEVLKKPDAVFESSTRTPYHRHLKNLLIQDNKPEFAKQFIVNVFALTTDYLNTGYTTTGIPIYNLNGAMKRAISDIQTSIKSSNPNVGGSLFKKNKESKLRSAQFLKWVKEAVGRGELEKNTVNDLLRSELAWMGRYNDYMASLPYHFRQLNMGDIAKKHLKVELYKNLKRKS